MRNSMPVIQGAWVRRPGGRSLGISRHGQPATLRSFDFSVVQPYQLEFTDLFVRFWAGLSELTTIVADGIVYISSVSNTNPAKVFVATAIPNTWANGDTIFFRLPGVPVTCTSLLGRTFTITNLDTGANTFTLQDPITGADVDATAYAYAQSGEGATPDSVEKIFELATPYGSQSWKSLRTVQDVATVLCLHGSYASRVISAASPFQINTAIFNDGPYLDVNITMTTLTPSGVNGSITVTASSQTGINGGAGFKTTDVGRLIRFQSGPPLWSNAVTYDKNFVVTGSDGNVYLSVSGSNLNHDPTTDDATHWQLNGTTITWTWLKITARSSATVVTATVMGANLSAANATTIWRLGLYSDTTGWPTCGAYHEGRLWLSGVVGNRIDAGTSDNLDVVTGASMVVGTYNFSPTAIDGTVADANGIASTFNAVEVNTIFWMVSTDDGLICGTQAGEWRVKASVLDDPITPTSIQARRVSTYGCANIEPNEPGGETVFVQRQKRRLIAHKQISASDYIGADISQDADHLTVTGIEEITYQQEPNLCVWMRRGDGALIGCTYQKKEYVGFSQERETINAFHRHDHGYGRTYESIQGGPAYNGLSDALYMVTNQTNVNAPDYNVRWIETLAPIFDAASEDWEAFLIDGGSNPQYAQRYAVANGDSFDGIRIFGLWNLNGLTVDPVFGGLDLGTRTVANGYAQIPFGSDPEGKFTLTFFTAQSNGTDYDIFQTSTGYVIQGLPVVPPIAANTLLAYVGPDSNVIGSRGSVLHVDATNNRVIEVIAPPVINSSYGGGLRNLNATTGNENLQADNYTIYGPMSSTGAWSAIVTYNNGDVVTGSDTFLYQSKAGGNLNHNPVGDGNVHWEPRPALNNVSISLSYLHKNGSLYMPVGGSNTCPMARIDASALTLTQSYGATSSSLAGSGTGHLQSAFNSMSGPRIQQSDGSYHDYLVFVGLRAASTQNEITILTAAPLAYIVTNGNSAQLDELLGSIATGFSKLGSCSWVAIGWPGSGLWPVKWLVGTTYAAADQVFGSNGLSYQSIAGANIGNDPTIDAGVHWTLIPNPVGLYHFDFSEKQTSFGGQDTLVRRTLPKIGPKTIDSTWTTMRNAIGPAFDQTDGNILCLVETADSVTNQTYLVKFSAQDGSVLWKVALPNGTASDFGTTQSMSAAQVTGKMVFIRATAVGPLYDAYIIDTVAGSLTTQAINSGFGVLSAAQYYDPGSGSVTLQMNFTPPGSGPTMAYLGTYLANNADTLAGQWGRLYLGVSQVAANTVTTYEVPVSVGASFTSQGQLLRPDQGPDAGAQNGPAFGKTRRLHRFASLFYRSRGVSFGTEFGKLRPVKFASPGDIPVAAPGLSSYVYRNEIDCKDDFNAQIAWEVTRPYPVTITSLGGFIQSSDV